MAAPPHTLRHAWITLARDAGVPLEDVQDAVGHADPRQTRAYDTDRGQLDRSPYILEQLLTRTGTGNTDSGHHQPPPTTATATSGSATASADSAEHVNSAKQEETSL